MAKTLVVLDSNDIDLKEDPLHKSVYATIVALMLTGPIMLKTPEGVVETEEEQKGRIEGVMRTLVANTLNSFTHDGFDIVKRESLPSAFNY